MPLGQQGMPKPKPKLEIPKVSVSKSYPSKTDNAIDVKKGKDITAELLKERIQVEKKKLDKILDSVQNSQNRAIAALKAHIQNLETAYMEVTILEDMVGADYDRIPSGKGTQM